jgi:aryl-alcohol dehydrogenase
LSQPRSDEVMVELEACGICHADIAAQHGGIPFPLPGVLGHEGAGHVVAAGANVTDLVVGDRVVLSFTFCGNCAACLGGTPGYCSTWPVLNLVGGGRTDGSCSFHRGSEPVHSHYFGQSSFSHRIVVAARAAVKVPDDIPAAVLAPLGCGVQTGVNAVQNVLRPKIGDRVAVFGAGSVGLSAVMGLALTGASQIIAIDVHKGRLDLARELGATDIIDASSCDVGSEIARLTGNAGINGAIETSGNVTVLKGAIAALAAAGTCVVVGVPHGQPAELDVLDLVARGLRVIGTNQGDAVPRIAIPRLIELYRQGRLPVDKIVSQFAFDAINEAVAASLDGSVVKAVLVMKSSGA